MLLSLIDVSLTMSRHRLCTAVAAWPRPYHHYWHNGMCCTVNTLKTHELKCCFQQSFWPPEMLSGTGRYGLPLDIWQLGCFFFSCVALYYPFGDDLCAGFRGLVMAGQYDERAIPEMYPQLRELIGACLAVDPSVRPTVEQVLQHAFLAE